MKFPSGSVIVAPYGAIGEQLYSKAFHAVKDGWTAVSSPDGGMTFDTDGSSIDMDGKFLVAGDADGKVMVCDYGEYNMADIEGRSPTSSAVLVGAPFWYLTIFYNKGHAESFEIHPVPEIHQSHK